MARSQKSYTFDVDTNLKVSAAETSSGAEALIVDLGDNTFVEGDVVIDVSAIDRTTGDEAYEILVQFSSSPTFASDVVTGAAVHLGEEVGTGGTPDASASGRIILGVNNERLGVVRRYMRLANELAGTTPSITYGAFFSKAS